MLADVRQVVGDFAAMKGKVGDLQARLEQVNLRIDADELDEIRDFLRWLADDHFTFLGYEEFSVLEQGDGGQIVYDENSLLGLSRSMRTGLSQEEQSLTGQSVSYLREPLLLSFAKAAMPSRVHRPAYPDFVSVREFDEQGRVVRECRFLGLFTSSVYTQSVRRIPFIRRKVETVVQRANFGNSAHLAKELVQVLEVLPRDELFQAPIDELFENAIAIVQIQERNRLRLFLRFDPYRRFCYCLVYVPRDSYSTETRLKIQQVLQERLEASDCEFSTYFSESVLTRVQFILRLDPSRALQVDPARLEQEVLQACRTWQDDYQGLVVERFGEAKGTHLLSQFPKGFPAGYRERFAAIGHRRHAACARSERRASAGDEFLPADHRGREPPALQALPPGYAAAAVGHPADHGEPGPARAR